MVLAAACLSRAYIPVVQLSIDETKPASFHSEIGKKLAPLRKEGALIGPGGADEPGGGGARAEHVVKTGRTPVLDGAEWRKLIDSILTETVRDLRDCALIATVTYSFARIMATLRMKVEDHRPQGAGWLIQLREKGGKGARDAVPSGLPRRYVLTSMLPASPRIERVGCSAPARGTTLRCCPSSR
jgi:hypothetical protein